MNILRHKIILFSLSLLPTLVFSAQQHITVFTEHLPPYQIQDKEGKLSGLTIDIFNELIQITGDIPKIQIMPWARAFRDVQTTPNSLIFSMTRTPEREDKFLWVGDILEFHPYFWGLRERFNNKSFSFNEIKQYIISIVRNSSGYSFLQSHKFPKIYPTVYEEQVIKMIYKGRADFFMSGKPTLNSLTQKLSLDIDKLIPVHKIEERSYKTSIAFNLESDIEVVQKYQQAFNQLKQSGKLEMYRQKWKVSTE